MSSVLNKTFELSSDGFSLDALVRDFEIVHTFLKPFLTLAEGASKLIGMFV
ncbi:hypothetical protein ACL1IW_04180 [Corynebacterium striatum]|uniref:hypothetical protein n=1 Tax=Corynebacterium TaxID=1716 RepID=UPI000B00A4C0|nr:MULTISPECIES: hypothetical protein [Corynebacterium]MDK7883816.1 hypothetical protein [Corynebacterium striatum]MDK8811434.1 hypothetical protein [Corynebacterium striatum]MDK8843734.1 hypothetical protein [Corynebacterium striatum]HAT1547060.1 hypothetical protein [Corynebacterium striatum]HCD4227276.1 hypothetical protein [Corynebacterium striatum]